ncbi:MAG: hypothetical protein AB7D35_11270 [Bacteroidales bacterium]
MDKELKQWKRLLQQEQSGSEIKPQQITGLPSGSGKSDITANKAIKISNMEQIINGIMANIQIQKERIMTYIITIDDSFIRQIMLNRHVELMSWCQVANEIGGGNTADSVRMAHQRFFEKN